MSSLFEGNRVDSRRLTTFAWIAFPVVLTAFAVLRLLSATFALILASQLVFLSVVWAAFALNARALAVVPRGRDRVMSKAMTITLGLLGVAETGYSLMLVYPGLSRTAFVWLPDVFNVMALVGICAFFYLEGGLDHLPGATVARVALDAICVLILIYVGLYRYWVHAMDLVGGPGWDPGRWTAYMLIGLVVFAGNAMMLSARASTLWRGWERLEAAGIGIYSVGLVLWPVWFISTSRGDAVGMATLAGIIYLAGYFLLAMSAISRIASPGAVWRRNLARKDGSLDLYSLVIATIAMLSAPVIGVAVLAAESGSDEQFLYLFALSAVTVAIVGRNVLGGLESDGLRHDARTDPETGALNKHALDERCEELIARSRRAGERFGLLLVEVWGNGGSGDGAPGPIRDRQVMADVASALRPEGDVFDSVFHLGDGRFAVLNSQCMHNNSGAIAHRLLSTVQRFLDVTPVTASVGVAVWPDHAPDREGLLAAASTAALWARLQGGNRASVFSEQIAGVTGMGAGLTDRDGASADLARALAAAADAIEPSRDAHASNVAALSLLLGDAAGFDSERLRRLRVAAMLHDVGKIALPHALVAGRVTGERQRRETQAHSALGERLVTSLGYEDIPGWIRSHHERWDGAGYPDGLVGSEIPVEARIIALADAYDVMTRVSRGPGFSRAAALQEIDQGIGTRFDPELAEIFIAVVAETEALGWVDGRLG